MHFAALSQVGECMREPGPYWATTWRGSVNLFEAAVAAGCRDVVFSSTCATYGDQDNVVLDETAPSTRSTPTAPRNARSRTCCAISIPRMG